MWELFEEKKNLYVSAIPFQAVLFTTIDTAQLANANRELLR
jgi:hypothetical protein